MTTRMPQTAATPVWLSRGRLDRPALQARIHGCLAGVAVGDALGFPAHDLESGEVLARFGGPLDRFHPAHQDDPIHVGYSAGRVTDDTILTLVTASAVLNSADTTGDATSTNGACDATTEDMVQALYGWAREHQDLWRPGNVFGPSTKKAFDQLLASGGRFELDLTRGRAHDGASNGAAMRMAPAGLAHPGDPERAARTACLLALPTHPTQVALAAAASLAAGVATALQEEAEVLDVVQGALLGARLGEQWGRAHARIVPAPNIERRLYLAADAALSAPDPLEAARSLHELIGGNLHAAEAMPTALGVFVAAAGDPRTAAIAAASAGGDSDTIASMSAGLAGALRGIDAIPRDWIAEVERVNGLDLESVADALVRRVVSTAR